ncbi:MAG: hypothetical protein PHD04_00615 [Candidatus Pacebacteria bacterium]|nr:hypothetical protein [Candidatus Paceibacterota bacterium]
MSEFTSYQHGEGRTGIGQLVEFSCRSGGADEVREFLKTIRTIDVPTTKRVVNVGHGGYGQYTRFTITQHQYAGGGHPGNGGYIEVLEIKDPPDGRWGIVINEHRSGYGQSSTFTEWNTLESANAAWEKHWGTHDTATSLPKCPGFKRRVECGLLRPWFYAIGDEQLLGDYAFPEGLQDDEVFRLGKKFVVYSYEGVPMIKTCMGTRYIKQKSDYHPYEERRYRIVCWDDGSVWNEGDSGAVPRPAEEGELWIVEAVKQFHQLLAGKRDEFVIRFTDGNKFVGKLVCPPRAPACKEGRYDVIAAVKGEKEPRRGNVDFKPTPEAADIVQYVMQGLAKKGLEVERVEVKHISGTKGGKRWMGVFLSPSANTT